MAFWYLRVKSQLEAVAHFSEDDCKSVSGQRCVSRTSIKFRAPRFLEYGEQRATLDVGEDEPRFLVDRVDTGRARRADAAGSDGASCRPVGCQASLVVL